MKKNILIFHQPPPSDLCKSITPIKRIEKNNVQEVILALSTTMEGQTTSYVISDKLERINNLEVTRLAQGVPFGGEVHYLDENTLSSAFQSRKKII